MGVPQIDEATPDELVTCPFCEGREDRTPPEALALPTREPENSPGWTVRVVPNLYPAFERQEVVVHTPRHARSFAELTDDEVELVAEAWRLRAAAARQDGFGYVHAFVNEGRAAGASLPHSHSQLVWMRDAPAAAGEEHREGFAEALGVLHSVAASDGLVIGCPPASRVPYELLIAPTRPSEGGRLEEGGFGPALRLLRDGIRRLRAVEGPVPWNAWLHYGTSWHIEVVPRLTIFAGVELGAGIYVNTLEPAEAADRLRAV